MEAFEIFTGFFDFKSERVMPGADFLVCLYSFENSILTDWHTWNGFLIRISTGYLKFGSNYECLWLVW